MDDVSPRTVGVDLRANQIDPLTQLLAAGQFSVFISVFSYDLDGYRDY